VAPEVEVESVADDWSSARSTCPPDAVGVAVGGGALGVTVAGGGVVAVEAGAGVCWIGSGTAVVVGIGGGVGAWTSVTTGAAAIALPSALAALEPAVGLACAWCEAGSP
jgi:hypothetical protein